MKKCGCEKNVFTCQSHAHPWTCAYDGTRKKLKDGRCAACGRSSEKQAKLDAIAWDSEPYDDAKTQHTPTPMKLTYRPMGNKMFHVYSEVGGIVGQFNSTHYSERGADKFVKDLTNAWNCRQELLENLKNIEASFTRRCIRTGCNSAEELMLKSVRNAIAKAEEK